MPARQIKKFGWIPDLPDHRDHRLLVAPQKALPPSVDLRTRFSKVEDQGQLGSCTANAIVANLEFLEKQTDPSPTNLSRLFLYYNERAMIGTVGEDSGAYLRDGVKSLTKQGICTEKQWPYSILAYAMRPTAKCYELALKKRSKEYLRLDTLHQMKSCLADGFPFVFGFTVYESFDTQAMATTGVMPMPGPNEGVIGGHAVTAAGFDDASRRAIIRNSWDITWGLNGYFTMPYEYLENRDLSDDYWTLRK